MAVYTSVRTVLQHAPELDRSQRTWSVPFERLFAAGFPQVRWLVQGHRDEAKADAIFEKVAKKRFYPSYGLAWPEQLTARLLRHWFSSGAEDDFAPFEADDASAAWRALARGKGPKAFVGIEQSVYLVEAFVGPEAAASGLLDAAESMDDAAWTKAPNVTWGTWVAYHAIQKRVPAGLRGELRARLEALRARRPLSSASRMLDVLLGDAEVVRSHGAKVGTDLHPWMGTLIDDDPAFVASLAGSTTAEGHYHARLAFVGGDEATEVLAKRYRGIKNAGDRLLFAQSMGALRHPSALRVLVEALENRSTKKALASWLDLGGPELATALEEPTVAAAAPTKTTRETIAADLVAALGACRGDQDEERAALRNALERFVELAGGGPAYELGVAEFFVEEGSVDRPPPLECVEGASEEDTQRWSTMLLDLAGY